jgi:cyanate permease
LSIIVNEAASGPHQSKYRWVVLAAVWLLYASFGLCMRSLPPIVTPILRDLNMTYSEMGFILGSWQLVYIPVAVFAGFAIDKWGIRRSLFIGALIIAVSEGLRYYATGFITLLPLVALFGIGGPLISIGAPKVVSSWFRGNDRATAVGIYTTAPWIGGLFSIAATNSIIMPLTGESWRLTLLYYGFLTLIFAFVWGIFARNSGQGEVTAGISLKELFIALVKIRNVRIVLAAGLLSLFVEHGFSHWLPKMLENRGFSPEDAGFLAAVPLIAAIPAVLLLPRFIPGPSRGRYIAVLSVISSAGLLLSYIASSWVRTLGLAAYGVSAPSLLPLLMLVLMEEPEVGPRHMGLAGGMFFCIAEIGGFSGPLLMGGLVDFMDSFMPGIIFFTVTGVILGLIILMVRANRNPE